MTELRIPLLNATTGTSQTFEAGFSIRPVSVSERAQWFQDPLIRDVVPHRVLPSINAVLVCEGVNHSDEADPFWEDVLVWFGLASLWTGRAVEASFCEEWWCANTNGENTGAIEGRRFGPPRYLTLSLPVSEAPPWNGPIVLAGLADKMKGQIDMFRSERPFAGTFRFALARWFWSLNRKRRTLEDAVLDLSIALESLFVLESEREGVGKLLRERLTRFWWREEGTKKQHNSLRAKINDVYDVRSRIVHGSVVHEERLRKARNILDQLIRQVLSDFIMGKLDNFEPRELWLPPHSEPCMNHICIGTYCRVPSARSTPAMAK